MNVENNPNKAELPPLARRLADFIDQSSGWFWLQDLYKELNLFNNGIYTVKEIENNKSVVRNLCKRLVEKGRLERDPYRDGHLRKVEDDLMEMDLLTAEPAKPLDIKYPFGLEKYVLTLPRSIIVIAGEPNAGKTAFLLNFCLLNQWKQHVVYFSSEMGASRLRARLDKHPDIANLGIGFQAFERGYNFHDAVGKYPEAINVIDYLEIYENFYEIGAKMKDIFDKLKGNGICVIATQKNPSKKFGGKIEHNDLGRGGTFGLEKASLYLAMDSAGMNGYSRLKIVKAKEWAQETINPNGLEWGYKLVNGCQFVDIIQPIDK